MLEDIVENDILYKFIDWTDQSYQTKKQFLYIDYEFGDTYKRDIDVKLYSGRSRFINILINRSGNNVIIIDKKIRPNIKYCNNYIKEETDIYKMSHNVDSTSYFSHKTTVTTNTGYEKEKRITSIHVNDETGNLISYYDSEDEMVKNTRKNKSKTYCKKIKQYNQ